MSEPKPHQKPIQCIGIILDGNRRWAKGKGLPTLEGHRRGFENLKSAARWVRDRGIPHLVVYAFSTENWNRAPEEVSYLIALIKEGASKDAKNLAEEKIKLRFVGEKERFAPDVREVLENAERESPPDASLTLWICLSYGGRTEIVAAAREIESSGEEMTEDAFTRHLWTAGMPDPDIIIRTGGHYRLSNFLMWQSAYSELFFLKTLWPDFSEQELDDVLEEFAARTRNFGV
ncbi:di-trans,poly-cis-decaprenylcistransferase [Candidatus Kaiserbacteria bacterium RIFCSPHIGHO2_01_FULL_56_24]|uniref:Isoprenyl transferase n=1 Tax=Candidatus Kaiserbacteria bacterium RIFCSPHIGHO2_01_FULL_56_24 TaxID=1798487 RepID=A0A1F6DAW4_9BACT|nr:MAG: di-trans,poly-cis-decaprenylcistransferase [Candidatus Kaiserbacteria bacterium RIFCSPHIGHO2_01_FULL_56_24]